jgi:hypothetical protein
MNDYRSETTLEGVGWVGHVSIFFAKNYKFTSSQKSAHLLRPPNVAFRYSSLAEHSFYKLVNFVESARQRDYATQVRSTFE